MEIREYTKYNEAEILPLYQAVGWTNYTEKPEMLKKAFAGAMIVLAAWEDNKLVGILRAVGDGASILYVQDILVYPEYQRRGIGKKLLYTTLQRYNTVYQTVLMTDNTPKTIAFYQNCGFTTAEDLGCCGFIKIYRG